MQYADAKLELARHAGIADDYYEHGFVGCFRPYSGIRDENFHAVVEALLSIGEVLSETPTIDRSVVESVWRITTNSRRATTADNGMLVRNKLITPEDRLKLRRWIRIIEDMMLDLLAGNPPHETIHAYCEYVAELGWGENAAYFVPLLSSAIEADDLGDRIQAYCAAVTRLGKRTCPVADALLNARKRKWDWYEPQDRCAAEMRGYLDEALAAIGDSQAH
ncbi:hypothetical protein [Bremerella sp.]|uniref:hypothetical protein n=1 Tax=Bremerella sp. TaxID=2795602 RepID=UPI0039198016